MHVRLHVDKPEYVEDVGGMVATSHSDDGSYDSVRLCIGSADCQAVPYCELPNGRVEPCSPRGCLLLTLAYLLIVIYSEIVVLLTGLLFTYLYEYLTWSVDASTLLATMYQLSCFVFGVVMVVMTRFVAP